jgi:Zn-dependent protease with chaperone function
MPYHDDMGTFPAPIDAARALLPWWVGWAPLAWPLAAYALAYGASRLAGWIGFGEMDRTKWPEMPWWERARVSYGGRVANVSCVVFMPVLLGVMALFFKGGALARVGAPLQCAGAAVAAGAGALAVQVRSHRLLFGRERFGWGTVGADAVSSLIVRLPHLVLAVSLVPVMAVPITVTRGALLVLAATVNLWLVMGGGFHLSRALGLVRPAPPRLAAAVDRAAATAGVQPAGVHLIARAWANAYAFPLLGRIAFTPWAVEVLDDAELEAIAAHELGHLAESPRDRWLRAVPGALVLPLLWAMFAGGRQNGALPLILLAAFVPLLMAVRRLRARGELHADRAGHGHHAEDAAVYARALERLYAANLTPAVLAVKRVHPHLYDRMTAAGSAPSYPRPAAPSRRSARTGLAAALLVTVGAIVALRVGLFFLPASLGPEGAALVALADEGGGADELDELARIHAARGDLAGASTLVAAADALELRPMPPAP